MMGALYMGNKPLVHSDHKCAALRCACCAALAVLYPLAALLSAPTPTPQSPASHHTGSAWC